jgi:prolyl oligopeptidase
MAGNAGFSMTKPFADRSETDGLRAEDPWLWLEERAGGEALEWVRRQNKLSLAELATDPRYQGFFDTALELLTAEDRIAYGYALAGHVYNFWQDKANVLGLWRRAPVSSYKSARPEWETLVDFDALAAEQGTKWVFGGAVHCYPDFQRCLVYLSPDGGDASEAREFDIAAKRFVEDGYWSPSSKSTLTWLDADNVLVASAHDAANRTASGYPPVIKLWRRGTALDEAPVVYEIARDDLAVSASVTHDGNREYCVIHHSLDFFRHRGFLRLPDGQVRQIPLPDDATHSLLFKGQLVFGVRIPWVAPDGTECRPNGLYSFDFECWIDTGSVGPLQIVLAPAERVAVAGTALTRDRFFAMLLDSVRSRVIAYHREGREWRPQPVELPQNGNAFINHAETYGSSVSFNFTDFLTPPSVIWSDDDGATLKTVKSLPARFDAAKLVSEQFEAQSDDGTAVPYFVVRTGGQDGPAPALLHGYGGFRFPMLPSYSALRGKLWLEEGNVFVLAAIRGGGEFGPQWHQAALKENRQRGFDDFAAVARDLVARGITTPSQLGIQGGSNGGLLTGVSLTQRPELFGAVISEVPLLDMLRYTQLPPGASWAAEYGDPEKPEDAAFLTRYSPYQNVKPGRQYPPVLFMTSTADDRVHPGHARKMAALMQAQGYKALFYEETEGGHGGRGDLRPRALWYALELVFLYRSLGA